MKTNPTTSLSYVILVAFAVHLVGCTAIVHNAVVSAFPTFQEIERTWPPLAADRGRVVVFWPRLAAQGFTPLPTVGGFGSILLTIDGDKSKRTTVGDQTFVFVDLSPGTHSFEAKTSGLLGTKKSLPVDVCSGQIAHLKIETSQLANHPPKIVEATEARQALVKIHHNYKKPVPFDHSKRGRPAF